MQANNVIVKITITETDVREIVVHADSAQLLMDTVRSMGGQAEIIQSHPVKGEDHGN